MKKLTAFLAIVALGLFSSLTANAQIQITVTKVNTTPAVLSSTGIAINTSNLLAADNAVINTPLVSGPTYFDLGYMRLTGTLALTAGNFILDTEYTINVKTADNSFDETQTIHINYSIVSDPVISGQSFVTSTNITGSSLASFAFEYDGAQNVLSFVDDSTLNASRFLLASGLGNPLQVGNLGLIANLVVNPVPEPSTYALMGASGLAALAGFRRFRSKKANKA